MFKNKGFSAIILIIILAVVVGGGYGVWKNRVEVPEPTGGSPTSTTPSPLGRGSGGVEGWKTYRNDEYGFEFKYPTQLSFDEIKGTTNPECLSVIDFWDKKEAEELGEGGGDVQSYFSLCVAKSLSEARDDFAVQWEPTVLDNKTAMKGMVTSYPVLLVELIGGKGLTIYSARSVNLLNQILPTFRFTTSIIDTFNWKTYRDEAYQIEIKYPPNYSPKENVTSNGRVSVSFYKEGLSFQVPIELVFQSESGVGFKDWVEKRYCNTECLLDLSGELNGRALSNPAEVFKYRANPEIGERIGYAFSNDTSLYLLIDALDDGSDSPILKKMAESLKYPVSKRIK
ncbi:MAG: hypothetical protein AAB455_03825 [Patescibacteria group bacterium]